MEQLPDYFNTINNKAVAEYKDRGSRFIAIALPFKNADNLKQQLTEIKKEYTKASHYCFAYRLGLDGNQYRVSDDGEPSGTAGKPILGQIDSRNVTDILIVVVRYFGGTLLGVPGLTAAYKSASAMVLQITPLVRKPVLIYYQLHFDYTKMNEVMIIIKQFDCEIINQQLQLFCDMEIGIPQINLTEAFSKFNDLRDVEITEKKS